MPTKTSPSTQHHCEIKHPIFFWSIAVCVLALINIIFINNNSSAKARISWELIGLDTNQNITLDTELNCQDNKDDDKDGKFDCFDSDCQKCDDGNTDTVDYCLNGCGHLDLFKEIGVKPSEITCAKVFSGSDTSGTKISIVFVADGYTAKDSFDSKILYDQFDSPELYGKQKNRNIKGFDLSVNQELDKKSIGLFGFKPYQANKEKFDIYTLRSTITWGCGDAGNNSAQSKNCPQETIKKIIKTKCALYGVQPFIVALNINEYVGLGMGSFTYAVGNANTHVAHEFGAHSFGGLLDEYLKEYNLLFVNYSNYSNFGDVGCTNWCGGIDANSTCYPHYQTYQNCLKSNMFDYCFKRISNNYFNATGKGFESDCNIGKNCLEQAGCYFGVNRYRQMNNDVARWHWYGAGFRMPSDADDVYYKKLRPITDKTAKKAIILNPAFPVNPNGYFENNLDPLKYDWWTVRWEHLDTEGCPKWCAGLDTKSQCYPYYQKFKQCAEEKLKTSGANFTEADNCWQEVASKYKKNAGKNLADGCALGLNCKNNAECIWPGGGLIYPYVTFRKNLSMPYWGFGSYSEKIIKDKIDILFNRQDQTYVNIEAIKKQDSKICSQLYGDKLSSCLYNMAKTIIKSNDCTLLTQNINTKICSVDQNLLFKCEDKPEENTKLAEYCYYQVAVKNNDLSLCAKSTSNQDKCFEEVGIKTNKLEICDRISSSSPDNKDTCVWTVIGQSKNIKGCETNKIYSYSQDSCKSLAASTIGKSGKLNDCQNISEQDYKEICYIEAAGANEDTKICDDNIKNSYNRKECYRRVAKALGDSSLCDQAEKISMANMTLAGGGGFSYSSLEWCYIETAITSDNIDICQKLPFKKLNCINEVAKGRKDEKLCAKIGTGNTSDVAACELAVELEKNK